MPLRRMLASAEGVLFLALRRVPCPKSMPILLPVYEMTKSHWIGIGITLLAAGLTYGLFLRHGVAPAVVGYNLVPSERVLLGEVPYRDFIYNYTPGVLWLNASLFKLLGTTLMTARVGVYCSKLIAALLLYYVGRRYLQAWLALMPVMMMLCWVGYGDILKVFPTQYGMALLIAAWAILTKSAWTDRTENGSSQAVRFRMPLLVAAGALAGAVFLFKQNVGVFACAAVVASAACSAWSQTHQASTGAWKNAFSRALAVTAGIAIILIPAAGYLASKSALLPMLEHFRRHAVAYEEAKGIALPAPAALLVSSLAVMAVAAIGIIVFRSARRLIPHFTILITILLLVIIAIGDRGPSAQLYRSLAAQVYYLPLYAVLAGVIWAVVEYVRGNRAHAAALAGLVLIPAAAFIEVFPRSDPDHLVRVLPPSLLLVCALVYELAYELAGQYAKIDSKTARSSLASGAASGVDSTSMDGSNHSSPSRFLGAQRYGSWFPSLLVVGVAVVISAIGLRVTWAPQFDDGFRLVENTPLEFERGRGVYGSQIEADRFNRVVDFVQHHSDPGDPIFTNARKMTATYFFAARPNTTRMLWFDSAGIPSEDRELVYQAIQERRFKLILTAAAGDSDVEGFPGIEASETRIRSLLGESYHKTATIAGINIFEPGPP
jgi:hypothetical protein